MSIPSIGHAGILATGLALLYAYSAFAATPGEQAAADVTSRIEARNCVQAVERLKDGLRKEYGEVELLAGTLYDHGVCVKRDWSRAVPFYVQAHAHGIKAAAERLAAGYADPLNGPDIAAAIWWAARSRVYTPASLGISEAAATDPDRLVAELRAWPPARLANFNYVIGVISTIASEMRYPALAQRYGLGGEVIVRFFPSVQRIEVRRGETREYQLLGVYNANVLRDRLARPVNNSFDTVVEEIAGRALRRYPKPPGILPDGVVEARFLFVLEDE
jgi:hypothetical protein